MDESVSGWIEVVRDKEKFEDERRFAGESPDEMAMVVRRRLTSH